MMRGPTGSSPRPRLRKAVAALEDVQFRWLFASNVAFFFAMNGQMIVRSWLTYELTDSKLALGAVSLAVALGMFLISPFGGVIADRLERRRVIVVGQAVLVLNEIVILGLLIADLLVFWHLLAAAAVMGCVFPFIMPARQAIVVNIVGKRGLVNAMALSMGAMNASRVVAPALAGFLIGPIGIVGAYIVGVVIYVVGLLCMLRIRRSPPPLRAEPTSILHDLIEGFRFIAHSRLVLVLLIFGLVPMFLAMPFQTLLVVFAKDIWNVGSTGFGWLQAAAGVGGMVGSIYLRCSERRASSCSA